MKMRENFISVEIYKKIFSFAKKMKIMICLCNVNGVAEHHDGYLSRTGGTRENHAVFTFSRICYAAIKIKFSHFPLFFYPVSLFQDCHNELRKSCASSCL